LSIITAKSSNNKAKRYSCLSLEIKCETLKEKGVFAPTFLSPPSADSPVLPFNCSNHLFACATAHLLALLAKGQRSRRDSETASGPGCAGVKPRTDAAASGVFSSHPNGAGGILRQRQAPACAGCVLTLPRQACSHPTLTERAGFDLPSLCKVLNNMILQLNANDSKDLKSLVDLLFLHDFILSRAPF